MLRTQPIFCKFSKIQPQHIVVKVLQNKLKRTGFVGDHFS